MSPVGPVMSRFTFHFVWLFISTGIVSTVYGGPIWAYPLALVLALMIAPFVVAYPTDNSLRWTLGAFGGLLVAGAATQFVEFGLTWISVNQSASVLLFGIACLWAATFPLMDESAGKRDKIRQE